MGCLSENPIIDSPASKKFTSAKREHGPSAFSAPTRQAENTSVGICVLSTIMYNSRQLAYAPTPYVPRSSLSATINQDEVPQDLARLVLPIADTCT